MSLENKPRASWLYSHGPSFSGPLCFAQRDGPGWAAVWSLLWPQTKEACCLAAGQQGTESQSQSRRSRAMPATAAHRPPWVSYLLIFRWPKHRATTRIIRWNVSSLTQGHYKGTQQKETAKKQRRQSLHHACSRSEHIWRQTPFPRPRQCICASFSVATKCPVLLIHKNPCK